MRILFSKLPFFVELLFNGIFILFYSLNSAGRIPGAISPDQVNFIIEAGAFLAPLILLLTIIINYLQTEDFESLIRTHLISLLVFVPLVITWGDIQFAFWLSSIHLISSFLSLYERDESDKRFKKFNFGFLELKPAKIVFLSFAILIGIGTFLIMLPASSAKLNSTIPFVDALFVITSAACVTGLSTISIGNDLSIFGQIVVLVVIQIGGLSIMTLYSSIAVLLGKNLSTKERVLMQDLHDAVSLEELFEVILNIIKYTFFIELWGGIVLTFAFSYEGFEFGHAMYLGFYHSISAFCNAGFSTFDTSLESYNTTPLIHGTIAVLIILGGIGFIVLKECWEAIPEKKPFFKFSLHSKIVLLTTFYLLAAGTVFIFFSEYLNALEGYNTWEKLQISFFQSATLRTAGFSSIPLLNLQAATLFVFIVLMAIGGSPGSTAGGIKTTNFAILLESIRTTFKGRRKVHMFDRVIAPKDVIKAVSLVFLYIFLASFFLLILVSLEKKTPFLPLLFETISAFSTVGLTLGVSPTLSYTGKLLISLVMFVGRIGPLTFVLAVGERESELAEIEYPTGRVLLG
jgi:trk system potassium uptake protein